MKKLFFALILAAVVFCGAQAHARVDQGWHICTVNNVGQLFGNAVATLECDGYAGIHWVRLNPDKAKELLATALTAQSQGGTVRAWVMGDTVNITGLSNIQTLYGLMMRNQ